MKSFLKPTFLNEKIMRQNQTKTLQKAQIKMINSMKKSKSIKFVLFNCQLLPKMRLVTPNLKIGTDFWLFDQYQAQNIVIPGQK